MDGVILPPPLVREIIDKTAGFVVKNGRAFETRITGSAQGATLKFAFLGADHPFHAYYEHKIVLLQSGQDDSDAPEAPASGSTTAAQADGAGSAGGTSSSPGGTTTPLRPTQVLTPTRLAQRLADAEGNEGGEDGEL